MNRDHSIEDIPVIMISSDDSKDIIRRAFERGVSDYINRPFDARTVYRRAFNTIRLYAKQRRLVRMVSAQTRKQEHNTTMLVNVLSQIVEFRNGESSSHVRHIRILTEKIMAQLLRKTDKYSLSSEEQDNITLASAPARHRQDRHRREDTEQARPPDAGGVRDHEDPHHRGRGPAPPTGKFRHRTAFADGLRHRPLAPRAVGWPGLSGRPGRRRHPHRGAAGLAGRCL